ncbi:MAG TPA: glycoside hydrolase family 36 protein [Anaerolineales bacterium]|nr:glycoside hydrolase family 36 protein [Anaerolineales bacterium]
MAFTLSNPHLHFTLDPAADSWSLFTQKTETPSIEGARFNGHFHFSEPNLDHLGGLRLWQWRGWLNGADIFIRKPDESPHGALDMLVARVRSGHDSLALTAEFALPQTRPFLLTRLRVQNVGRRPFRVARLNPLFAGPLHRGGAVRLAPTSTPLTFFSNGWQSWSHAGSLTADRVQPYTHLGPIQSPVNYSPHTPNSPIKGQFASDMFGVLACPQKHSAIVAGFLSQREQFGSVDIVADPLTPSIRLRAQCDDVIVPLDAEVKTDWAYVQLIPEHDLDPLCEYAEAVARENSARIPAETPVGWCSWYQYFDKVTEADVRSNLERLVAERDSLPLTLVQLDDGFQPNVGDWFETNEKFPSGLHSLAGSIRARGFTPGLWLAPFIARPDSKLARDHGDWFIRNSVGLPANAGYVFNTFARGLDPTHPAVQNHTRKLISTAVNEWGFPYLKLDFLYAAALSGGRHDPARTRAQAMRRGLEIIREAAGPETFILGCGCPLGSAVGLVDAMRIGPDVDVQWLPKYYGASAPFRDETGMPSARNSIRNTLARAPLHRRWWLNDPDCLLVRESTALTLDEVTTLATLVALSGGLFLLSDDLAALSPERRKLLEPLLPVVGKTALARDWLEREMPEVLELPLKGAVGEWKVFGLFNWDERPAAKTLPVDSDSHIFDFWNQSYLRAAEPLPIPNIPPHGCRLFAARPVAASAGAQYVGSSLHFTQGAEIVEWHGTGDRLTFVINLNRVAEGSVTIAISGEMAKVPSIRAHASLPTPGERLADGLYRFPVAVNKRAEVTVEW